MRLFRNSSSGFFHTATVSHCNQYLVADCCFSPIFKGWPWMIWIWLGLVSPPSAEAGYSSSDARFVFVSVCPRRPRSRWRRSSPVPAAVTAPGGRAEVPVPAAALRAAMEKCQREEGPGRAGHSPGSCRASPARRSGGCAGTAGTPSVSTHRAREASGTPGGAKAAGPVPECPAG